MFRKLLVLLFILLNINLSAQKLLFLGNSLTYTNELPRIVKTIANQFGKSISIQSLCFPNYGLEDHWRDGKLQKLITTEEFDFVIFQQGPSSQAYGRSSLIEYGGKISSLAKKHNSQPAYFMVWPSVQYYHTFDGVIKNHSDAANINKALLIRVGEAWRTFRKSNPTIDLYMRDRFHPSEAGSVLAALIHIRTLFPDIDLKSIKFNTVSQWIKNEDSFAMMLDMAQKL